MHTGARAEVRLSPSQGRGLRFRRGSGWWTARPDRVQGTDRGTSLEVDGHVIHTVEHLLAALRGLEIDDVDIEVDGPEIPSLDGSSQPWVEAIDQAGIREDRQATVTPWTIAAPVEVRQDDRFVRVTPDVVLRLAISVEFPEVGRQTLETVVEPGAFRRELAGARTFGFTRELAALRSANLIRGAMAPPVLLYGCHGPEHPEWLRFEDEVVRHKALDLVGDLALLGSGFVGCVRAHAPGHGLHARLTQRLAQEPGAKP